jgi:hypothetical protein
MSANTYVLPTATLTSAELNGIHVAWIRRRLSTCVSL